MAVGAETFDYLEPAQDDGELGRLGPYRILAALGRGGMGQVFRAEDSRLERPVALKVMHKRYSTAPNSHQRFIHEARSMAAIKHDNVVTVYEVGQHSGTPFMAMELLKGHTLESVTLGNIKLSYDQIFDYAVQIARGLAAAHARALVHRDIKPANIWIEESSGRVKILDFGLAVASDLSESLTARGAVVGTPAYLSPEQAQSEPLDDRSDLYSVGVVLYELCCGRVPYVAKSVPELLIKIIAHAPIPPRSRAKDLPQPFSDLILRLLAKEPHDRIASARALEQALEHAIALVHQQAHAAVEIVTSEPAPLAAATPRSEVKRATVPSSGKLWLIASAVSAAILLIGGVWWILGRSPTASKPMAVKTEIKEPEVLASSLRPLQLDEVLAGSPSVPQGQQARFQIKLTNAASGGNEDPRAVNAGAKVAAQVRAYLGHPGQLKRPAPAFPKKLSIAQLPSLGKSAVIEMIFGTDGLPPGEYDVAFELQSPKGGKVSEVSTRFIVLENLANADLLGFELIRTAQGRGADTFIVKGSADDYGGRPFIAVDQRTVDGKPIVEHAYLRFDLQSRANAPSDIDRVVLLLSVEADGLRAKSTLNAYGVPPDFSKDWTEKGERHLTWDSSPSAGGVESYPFLGQVDVDNTNGSLEKQADKIRIFGTALDEYVRQSQETVTILLSRTTSGEKATRFSSREGSAEHSPALAIRDR
ncbi:MAG: protein kinase domain-containing protein [Planctomycetaceae bacterium]